MSSTGEVKTRLHVSEVKSGKAIRDGNYSVPELKKISAAQKSAQTQQVNNFTILEDTDADFPF